MVNQQKMLPPRAGRWSRSSLPSSEFLPTICIGPWKNSAILVRWPTRNELRDGCLDRSKRFLLSYPASGGVSRPRVYGEAAAVPAASFLEALPHSAGGR